jgi:hypothetical protein
MRNFFKILACAGVVFFGSCGGGKNSVDKDALQGKYEVDLSGMTELLENEIADKGQLPATMVSMMLSQLDLTVKFESEKAIVDASAVAAGLLKGFSQNQFSLPVSLDYKIENDSLLYLKPEGRDFENAGVIKRMGDDYDYLKFVPKMSNDQRVELTLRRVK